MLNLKDIQKNDPLNRKAQKGIEAKDELSPMDPPDAYGKLDNLGDVDYEKLPESLKLLMTEHEVCKTHIDDFEKALIGFKESGFVLDRETSEVFNTFFTFLDEKVVAHNLKEEKALFPLLEEKLRASGEFNKTNDRNAIDMMEDDHVKISQLSTLLFNFLGLIPRLPDLASRGVVSDLAFHKGMEFIELLRLHIYKEDNTLFPMAVKLLTEEEFQKVKTSMDKYN